MRRLDEHWQTDHAAAGGSMFVYYRRLEAAPITASTEEELTRAGIFEV